MTKNKNLAKEVLKHDVNEILDNFDSEMNSFMDDYKKLDKINAI